MASMEQSHNPGEGWIRVFSPNTRCISSDEIPRDVRKKAEAGDEGVWLEVRCPENKCLTDEDNLTLPVRGVPPHEKEGLWHRLFCPRDECYAEFPTDIPS